MKITILAIGTNGDVRPLIALGKGLHAAGHEVCVATYGLYETFVRNYGLEFFLVQFDILEAMKSEAGQATMESGDNSVRSLLNFARVIGPGMRQIGADFWTACQTADAIICSSFSCHFGPNIAKKRNVPYLDAFLQPVHPTCAFANFLSPIVLHQHKFGGIVNKFTHVLGDALLWFPYRSVINQWCHEQLNFSPLSFKQFRQQQLPALCGFSPTVVPTPPDWGDDIEIAGYWFLDEAEDWQPPTDLVDFLEAGTPPVSVGFGSMGTSKQITKIVLEALDRTKQRGLFLTGWGGLGQSFDLPDNVFKIESVPHDWLFPRMAAVIHHGGAGTTAAGLRAGIPSIIIPIIGDQPFWGQRVANLGVGPPPILRKKLSVKRLVAAITTAIKDKEMQKRAAALGKQLQTEDGVARAVEIINRRFSNRQ